MSDTAVTIDLPALPDDYENRVGSYVEDEGTTGADFLRYRQGQWIHGSEKEELPIGTRLLAFLPGHRRGFIKFHGPNEEPEKVLVFIFYADERIKREDLGDTDEELWTKANGVPEDPWQKCRELDLYDIATGHQYIWTASSAGARNAMGHLVDQWQNGRAAHPSKFPVIALQSGSYTHKILKQEVKVPKVQIVDWQTNEPQATASEPELDDEIPF